MKEGSTKRGCIAGAVQFAGMGGVVAELATHQDIKLIIPTAAVAVAGLIAGTRITRAQEVVSPTATKKNNPLVKPFIENRQPTTTVFHVPTEPIDAEFQIKPPSHS